MRNTTLFHFTACLLTTLALLASCTNDKGPQDSKKASPPGGAGAPAEAETAKGTPTLVTKDPSTVALSDQYIAGEIGERYRILVDLDGDSHEDLILSEDIKSFGKIGGTWQVFLWRKGAYLNVGEIIAHQAAISFEQDHGRSLPGEDQVYTRVWVYSHMSASEGGFSYYQVGPKSIVESPGLILYTGDGGSEQGNAVYEAIFKHSEIPFRLETSQTDDKGTVAWTKYEPY